MRYKVENWEMSTEVCGGVVVSSGMAGETECGGEVTVSAPVGDVETGWSRGEAGGRNSEGRSGVLTSKVREAGRALLSLSPGKERDWEGT